MGRPRKFSREGVLEKVLPIFWNQGYAATTVQQLEQASGVNKSGLYAEFADKEDLFLHCLRHYFRQRDAQALLQSHPQGWNNIERYLRLGEQQPAGCRGCFVVNTLRELAVLPAEIRDMLTEARQQLTALLAENISAENPAMEAAHIAEIVQLFFSGYCIEQGLRAEQPGHDVIAQFMRVLRGLSTS